MGKSSQKSYFSFYKILGFYPGDIKLYEEALLHKSFFVKNDKGNKNNERLEFLGDAILDAIVADILFHHFKKKREGFLTNTRSKIVQRESLNKIALEMGLDKLIISSLKSTTHNNYIYGNALEALIGAIYLDKGYKKCKKFIEKKILDRFLNIESVAKKEVNFKSRLIEWSQKRKINIEFELIESFTDNDHNPIFQTRIMIGGLSAGIGIGYSKKESQQNAAQIALKKVNSDKNFIEEIISREQVEESGLIIQPEEIEPFEEKIENHLSAQHSGIENQK
ncbi:MAG: ribonuclease III [Candidatus Azobacteroides sp.]|nr:ribonuclease III [Candidatus Azobacteroides sp.]